MGRREDLIARILARPPEAPFRDVRVLLEEFGWTVERERGGHAHFVKPGEPTLSIPTHGGRMVKRVYLDLMCQRRGLDD